MKVVDQVKQSLMSLILENDLEPEFNELFNKYRIHKNKSFTIKTHLITSDKVIEHKEFFAYILLDRKEIKTQVFNDLIKLVYSDLSVARSTIYLKYYNTNFSFLSLSLLSNSLKLSEEQKKFIAKEVVSKDTAAHCNNGMDLRYMILRNNNWTVEEKLNLISKMYDPLTFESKYIEWKNNIDRKTIEKVDIDRLFMLTYEDYYCLLKDDSDADYVWNEVQATFVMKKYKTMLERREKDINRTYKKDDTNI